ncbi:hypothetical protein HZA57_06850 [Candidatus Poribacteria bacterium]|nr:hypothetical protein [Candidatus Poribacteria bacterium]
MKRTESELRAAAGKLALANVRAEPNISEVYMAPSEDQILLMEVDQTAIPNEEGCAIPLHFPPEPEDGLPVPSGVIMVTPEEGERRIRLPEGWGNWDQLIPIWPAYPNRTDEEKSLNH